MTDRSWSDYHREAPESIYNPRIIEETRYFVGTDPVDAVERFDDYEWAEDAERRADSLWAQAGEEFQVFTMQIEVNVTSAKSVYTAKDD